MTTFSHGRVSDLSRLERGWSPGHSLRHLAALLAERQEVTLIHSGYAGEPELPPTPRFREVCAELPEELATLKFACDDHRHSAAVMETIRRLYGGRGPDLYDYWYDFQRWLRILERSN